MVGKSSIDKGKAGEREIVHALQPIVDKVIKEVTDRCTAQGREGPDQLRILRNSLQSAVGGSDLHGLDWLCLEVKRQEQIHMGNWWQQTLDSVRPGQIPVLVWRQNAHKWSVRMFGVLEAGPTKIKVTAPVDITFAAFLIWFEWELRGRYLNF